MLRQQQLKPGTRVRLQDQPIGVTLRSFTGEVIGPDPDWQRYYLVRLDAPAIYHGADGHDEELTEVVEAGDNLEVLAAAGTKC